MTPYLADPDVTLYQGDALDILRELPDESVHCVATSPPFFGLRDYGTGRWEGGDADCDHVAVTKPPTKQSSSTLGYPADGGPRRIGDDNTYHEAYRQQYRDVCGKCGARRVDQQIGLEDTPDLWAARLVEVFREAKRVLRRDGSLWVECGDSYAANVRSGRGIQDSEGYAPNSWTGKRATGIGTTGAHPTKPKDLIGQPFLLAFALRADGWYWRGCNIWAKPNAMPESAKDRCTVAHSYVLHFSKSARYFFDGDAIAEPAIHAGRVVSYDGTQKNSNAGDDVNDRRTAPGANGARDILVGANKNPRSVWTIPTQGYPDAHFATWPEALARRIILAAVPEQVCGVCGKARERIVEVRHELGGTGGGGARRETGHGGASYTMPVRKTKHATLLGFTDCGHNAYTPGTVLDPFAGSGTTAYVARKLNRRAIGIDLNPEYLEMAARRLAQQSLFALAAGEDTT